MELPQAEDVGIEIGTKSLAAALKKVPGAVFLQINKAVGFRLVTKGGTTGVINVGKLVPFVGGPIGAGVEVLAMRGVVTYAKSNFPTLEPHSGP